MRMFRLFRCRIVCVARTCSTSVVPIPKASAPKAPCATVSRSQPGSSQDTEGRTRGMRVAAYTYEARQDESLFRANDMDDSCFPSPISSLNIRKRWKFKLTLSSIFQTKERYSKFLHIGFHFDTLRLCVWILDVFLNPGNVRSRNRPGPMIPISFLVELMVYACVRNVMIHSSQSEIPPTYVSSSISSNFSTLARILKV